MNLELMSVDNLKSYKRLAQKAINKPHNWFNYELDIIHRILVDTYFETLDYNDPRQTHAASIKLFVEHYRQDAVKIDTLIKNKETA